MEDLKRVRYVAENFRTLQGLKMVPLGLVLLVMAAGDAGGSVGGLRWLNYELLVSAAVGMVSP